MLNIERLVVMLWEASGVTDREKFSEFNRAATAILTEAETEVLSEAHCVVNSYMPICEEGMNSVYRTAFKETVKGCHAKVFELWCKANDRARRCL